MQRGWMGAAQPTTARSKDYVGWQNSPNNYTKSSVLGPWRRSPSRPLAGPSPSRAVRRRHLSGPAVAHEPRHHHHSVESHHPSKSKPSRSSSPQSSALTNQRLSLHLRWHRQQSLHRQPNLRATLGLAPRRQLRPRPSRNSAMPLPLSWSFRSSLQRTHLPSPISRPVPPARHPRRTEAWPHPLPPRCRRRDGRRSRCPPLRIRRH